MVKRKFIAFVGNLPYNTSEEDVKEFFKCLGEVDIRMRHDEKGKFKGFCFVECGNNDQFQKLLKMHHLKLKDRKVNIELSAGGGGNSKARREKISKKNEKITKFRKSLHDGLQKQKEKYSEQFKSNSKEPNY